jgi:hypothetical protein
MRNTGVALVVMLSWLFNFVVVMITLIGLKTLNYKFYIIWAVTNLAFMFIVYVFYPETARKSLEEIDLLFLKESEKDIKKEDEKVEGY